MKRLLLLTAVFLSGCAEIQQSIQDYQNAPKYREEYRPIQGILNSTDLYQANLVCSSEAEMYADEQDKQAEQNYIADSGTSYDCTAKSRYGSSDTIQAKCKPNTGFYSPSTEYRKLQRSAGYWGNSIKQNAFKIKMTSCMAQRGYSLQKVCYMNCYQPASLDQSIFK
jgi:hypothetical protein